MLYTKKFGIIVLCLIWTVVAVALGVSIYSVCVSENSTSVISGGSVDDFSSGWTNKYGMSFNVSGLTSRRVDFDTETPLELSKEIPEIKEDSALFFRSNNLRVKVYIDGELVKSTDELFDTSKLSSYQAYFFIPISIDDAGKNVRLELYKTPCSYNYCLDNVYFGTSYAITEKVFTDMIPSIVLGICILVSGIVFILCGIVMRKLFEHYRGMICYGFSCIFLSLWIICGSVWFYQTFNNIILAEKCRNIFLLAAVPFMLLFIFENFKVMHIQFFRVTVLLSFVLFFALTALDLIGIMQFGESAYVCHIYLLFAGITVIVEMASYLSKVNGSKDDSKVYYVAVIFFIVFGFFDILNYYRNNGGDFSASTRWGIFILTVATACSVFGEIAAALRNGIKAGKIGKMAFTDANTGIGNAAAFKQKMEELEYMKSRYQYIGIVQFDVNNLKVINDTKGHEAGDLLIKTAAQIIESSFGTIGNCYRTGGDEFVAITTYNHAPLECEKAINKFNSLIDQFNLNPEKPFDLRIALGIAYYRNSDDQLVTLKEIHKIADERMYKNKKELKARYARTPEEAVIR